MSVPVSRPAADCGACETPSARPSDSCADCDAVGLDAPGRIHARWSVSGMDCGSCVGKIETALRRLDGVGCIAVDQVREQVRVGFDPRRIDAKPITAAIEKLGHGVVAVADARRPGEVESPWRPFRAAAFAGALVAGAFALARIEPQWADIGYAVAALIAGYPVMRKALAAARLGSVFTIQMLMTVAVIGALFIGEGGEAAVVVALFVLGEALESFSAGRARSGVRALMDLRPATARLLENGVPREVPASTLKVDDVVAVLPGDRLPADGTVVAGAADVDQSPVSGESVPVLKAVGDEVFAGTVVTDADLRVKVRKAPGDTLVDRMIALVAQADGRRARVDRFIEKFSKIYTPVVVALALLVAAVPPLVFGAPWDVWIYRALALLLIGCPCALVISTPAAVAAGLATGARHGLLIKGGAALEALGAVRTVAFDKTGTLTAGHPQVVDVFARHGTPDGVLALAAAVEQGSTHPLARAIVAEATTRGLVLPPSDGFRSVAGQGAYASVDGRPVAVTRPDLGDTSIQAQQGRGRTVVDVMIDGQKWGWIALVDAPRPDAAQAMDELKALGVGAVMLTGDNAKAAQMVAEPLGMSVCAGLLPEGKLDAIDGLKADGPVAMVGDGINDAPALKAASVGIAMGGGTDAALETADAVTVRARLRDVPAVIKLSRRVGAVIKENITIALGLKAVFLVTTISGMTGLWMAILADTGATVLVTINALRLLERDPIKRNRLIGSSSATNKI